MSIMFNVNEEKKSLIENTAEEIVEKVSKGEVNLINAIVCDISLKEVYGDILKLSLKGHEKTFYLDVMLVDRESGNGIYGKAIKLKKEIFNKIHNVEAIYKFLLNCITNYYDEFVDLSKNYMSAKTIVHNCAESLLCYAQEDLW